MTRTTVCQSAAHIIQRENVNQVKHISGDWTDTLQMCWCFKFGVMMSQNELRRSFSALVSLISGHLGRGRVHNLQHAYILPPPPRTCIHAYTHTHTHACTQGQLTRWQSSTLQRRRHQWTVLLATLPYAWPGASHAD